MLKIQKQIEDKIEDDFKLEDEYREFFNNLADHEEGETYEVVGHKIHVIESETHWENVDLECCSGDKVTTIVFQLDKDKKTYYRVTQSYNSWGDSGADAWVKVKKKKKTVTVFEEVK